MTIHLRIMGRNEAIVAVGDGLLQPSAIVSIYGVGGRVPPVLAEYAHARAGLLGERRSHVPVLAMEFDDVPRDQQGYRAVTREQVQQAIAAPVRVAGDVLIHCAQGISRSAGIALAIRADQVKRAAAANPNKAVWHCDADVRLGAREALEAVVADAIATARDGFREGSSIVPNARIVWYADQIIGYNGHLLREYVEHFNVRDVWASLGEDAPASYPGEAS